MLLCRLVKGGGNHLCIHVATHIGHLLRSLIDQEDDHIYLGVVVGNGIGHILEQHRLTGLGLSNDQTALTLTDRGEEVKDAGRRPVVDVSRAGDFELEFLCREDREQVVKGDPVAYRLGVTAIETDQLLHGEELILALRGGDDRLYHVSCLETIVLDLAL